MAVALETFVKQLEESGVIALGKLENFVPPKAHPKDARELARQLVQSNQLTKFQAQEIYQGRAKTLILGNYTILDKIGAGGMGQVFKAQHRRMDRTVAIKMLPKNVMKDAATVARFEREVRAASKLLHPNIVSAFDADEADGIHFLAMEYVEGSDLSALVKKNGPFSLDKAVNYILQAARGLEFAHKKGVIHRDIKPANLLLDNEGIVKILDMGLARIESSGEAATQAELTGTGAVMGTVDYMAPEQALDTKHADARADIYSLGCSLYYLLSGKATYDGDTLMAKLLAHREKTIPSLGANVSEQVQAVFEKMVAKHVEDRYQSMAEVVAALEQCTSGQATSPSLQPSAGTGSSSDVMTFLRNVTLNTIRKTKAKPLTKTVPIPSAKKRKPINLRTVGTGLLGLAILAGVIFKMRTKDGMLVVEVNQPDAVVQVLNEAGQVEITKPGEHGMISISVDPGKHRLKVEKDGFVVFTKEFSVESGGKASITAKLEPVTKPDSQSTRDVADVSASPGDYALDFDGVKSYVVTPIRYDGSHPITIEALVAQRTKKEKLFVVGDAEQGGIALLLDDGFFQTGYRAKPTTGEFGALIQATAKEAAVSGRLYHVAGVVNTNEVRLFVDGVLQGTVSGKPLKTSPLPIAIGANPGASSPDSQLVGSVSEVFDGSIDEVRISKVARYISNFTPVRRFSPDADTIALYHFDEGSGDTAHDASGRGNDAKIVQAKWVNAKSLGEAESFGTLSEPAFQQWMKQVAAMPADQQIAATAKKLVELNPGFDGTVSGDQGRPTPLIEKGIVVEFQFISDNVADISPLSALPGLKVLICGGGRSGRGKFSDLVPLQDMKLSTLYCNRTLVSDLAPLKGMPLTSLNCGATKVSDLAPLQGMPLSHLWCGYTPVSDLSPLQDCKGLKSIDAKGTKVTAAGVAALQKALPNCKIDWDDPAKTMTPPETIATLSNLAFQKWMQDVQALDADKQVEAVSRKLQELNPGFDGKLSGIDGDLYADGKGKPKIENGVVTELRFFSDNVSDISPLRALAGLTNLNCRGRGGAIKNELVDLSPLQGLKLTKLDCGHTKVSDLSPLQGMPLAKLDCSYTPVSDLSPLRGMPLLSLACHGTMIANLSPLQGMPLTDLKVPNTPVSDLSPLAGMPLVSLSCNGTKISDLLPLAGMKLTRLNCDDTRLSDLTPLRGMELTTITLTPKNIGRGLDVIRHMASLKTISLGGAKLNFVPDEFWKKYDAGEFGKPITNINDPAFQAWMKTVTAMPAEDQVKAVSKKLMELNPGFDGAMTGIYGSNTPKIEDGVVTEIGLKTERAADISPVRALVGLKVLKCIGSASGNSLLTDLSPLTGMPLTGLWFNATNVSDLSPLQGMNLTSIAFTPSKITTGLHVIRQMTSLKSIGLRGDRDKFPPAEFWKRYEAGEFGKPDVATQLTQSWNTPAFQAWVKEVQAMPAEDQVKAVSKKLVELNPGFDGKVTGWEQNSLPKIKNGVVTDFGFITDNVTDISPVQVLAGLKILNCHGSAIGNGKLSSLSPLEDMKLTSLDCNWNPTLADLSPVHGMPLTTLRCYNTQVSDLSPLRGMNLTTVNVTATLVSELSSLQTMRLADVAVSHTQVADLSPLEGMPIASLRCEHTNVADLSPLGECTSLTSLDVKTTKVTAAQVAALQKALPNCKIEWDDPAKTATKKLAYVDPAFHKWVADTQKLPAEQQIEAVSKKLMELNPGFDGKLMGARWNGWDRPPTTVKGVVTELGFDGALVADVSPVQALSGLRAFGCWHTTTEKTRLSDLSPLTGLRLKDVYCAHSQVSDLSPLAGMPLTEVKCYNCPVFDLAPLRGMPLKNLACNSTNVQDLTALFDCKDLEKVSIIHTKVTAAQVAALQKTLPNCKIEWDDPAKTVTRPWESPAFQAWMKAVAVLPAETQVEAVSKRLVELNPGFDGKLTGAEGKGRPLIENGVVTQVAFATDNVIDISPVRALAGLKSLTCGGSSAVDRSRFADLSPLEGMSLTRLYLFNTQVSSLAPLQGMPLTILACNSTAVSELAPLKGMPLTILNCNSTLVSDLSSLEGCKTLQSLKCHNTKVTSVLVLQRALPNCEIEWDDPAKPKTPGPAASGTK